MKYLLTILFVSTYLFGKGQNNGVYLRAGFNVSSLTSSEYSVTPGYHLGIGSEKYFNEKLSMLHELVFAQQGAFVDEADAVQRIHYLQLPLLLKIQLDDNLHFTTGPQLGIVIGSDMPEEDQSLTATLRPLDISFSAGLGYAIAYQWTMGCRLNAGLTDVTTSSKSNPHSVAIQFSAIFNLKRDDKE